MINYLQKLIDEEIPIAQKMGVYVSSYASSKIRLAVPFDGNKNHKNTAFGGSIFSAMALSGWGLLAGNIRENEVQGEVVLQDANIEYKQPITTDFEVICAFDKQSEIDDFLDKLEKQGKAKISVTATITIAEELIVRFTGVYVAVV